MWLASSQPCSQKALRKPESTGNNFDNLVIGRLDSGIITTLAEGLELLIHEDTLLIEKTEYQNNLTLNKSLITLEMNPQLVAYKATDFYKFNRMGFRWLYKTI